MNEGEMAMFQRIVPVPFGMADETDEVKLFRVQEEDESDAPSLADDKKDVALEEEMESKPGVFGGLSAFHAPPSTPSSSLPMGFPFSPGMSPFTPFQQLAAFSNWQLNQAAANVALTNVLTAALSPVYPPLPSSPMNSVVDMYRNLGAIAALSPLTGGSGVGMMRGMTPMGSFRPYTPMQLMGFGGIGGGMNHPSTSSAPATPSGMRRKRTVKEEDKEEHIKKPKNAYFWFMDENRKVLMNEEEWKDKQSADLNKELGKRWHDMKEEDKRPYFEMAAKDKEDHAKKYPNWSARENYANSAKKKKKRDRTTEPGEGKKCRARFGVDAQDRWCKHCVRKKKCLHTGGGGEDDEKEEREERASSHSTHQRATDSESDLDDEPTTIPSDEDLKTSMTLTPLTPSFALNQLMLR